MTPLALRRAHTSCSHFVLTLRATQDFLLVTSFIILFGNHIGIPTLSINVLDDALCNPTHSTILEVPTPSMLFSYALLDSFFVLSRGLVEHLS